MVVVPFRGTAEGWRYGSTAISQCLRGNGMSWMWRRVISDRSMDWEMVSQLEKSSAERDPDVLVHNKLTLNQQHGLMAEAKNILGFIMRSIASGSREVIQPCRAASASGCPSRKHGCAGTSPAKSPRWLRDCNFHHVGRDGESCDYWAQRRESSGGSYHYVQIPDGRGKMDTDSLQ